MKYPLNPDQKRVYESLPAGYQILAEKMFDVENGIRALEGELGSLAGMTSEDDVSPIRKDLEASRICLVKNIFQKHYGC